jgi:hypothetical protein
MPHFAKSDCRASGFAISVLLSLRLPRFARNDSQLVIANAVKQSTDYHVATLLAMTEAWQSMACQLETG